MSERHADWTPETRLGDLISVKHGWPFKSQYMDPHATHGPVVVAIGNFRYEGGFRFDETTVKRYKADYPAEYELSPGDVVVVMTCQTPDGEILGIPGVVPDDGNTYLHNQRIGKIVIGEPERLFRGFAYYVFLWDELNRELFATSTGTKILHTAPSRIEDFRFSLPPLKEQQAIASILGALDEKIDLNRRMNETLESMARAVYKSWFVDFDPVVAKAAGKRPFSMDDATAALFPDRFVDSDLGPIPEGWRVAPIGSECQAVGGGTPSTKVSEYWDCGHIHWATPKDLSGLSEPLLTKTNRRITDKGLSRISSGLLPRGTVLLSSRAPVGYTAIATVPLAINQGFIALLETSALSRFFLYFCLQTHVDEILQRAGGTTFAEISKRNFRPIPLAVPPEEVVRRFSDFCGPQFALIENNMSETRTLAELRDLLLPKLLSGEIRVKDAEKTVQEAV